MISVVRQLWQETPPAAACVMAALLFLVVVAVRLSIIDVRTHTLPNKVVLPAYPVSVLLLGAAAVLAARPALLGRALAALLLVAGFFWLLWWVAPQGLGLGDVKLSGLLGLFLGFAGWEQVLWGVGAGFLLGGVWGLVLIASGHGTRHSHIPFGPPLLAGALAVLALPGSL